MNGRRIRRVTLLVLLLAIGAAVAARLRAARSTEDPNPSWPPFEPEPTPPSAAEPAARPFVATTPAPAPVQPEPAAWVAPVDGTCPEGYPIKANDNSRIFHIPGGRFYARTVPERCYAVAADALADGYRQAKA